MWARIVNMQQLLSFAEKNLVWRDGFVHCIGAMLALNVPISESKCDKWS